MANFFFQSLEISLFVIVCAMQRKSHEASKFCTINSHQERQREREPLHELRKCVNWIQWKITPRKKNGTRRQSSRKWCVWACHESIQFHTKHKQSAQPIQSGKKLCGENCETNILLRDENCKNERLIECNEPILLKLKKKISLLKKQKNKCSRKMHWSYNISDVSDFAKGDSTWGSHTTWLIWCLLAISVQYTRTAEFVRLHCF